MRALRLLISLGLSVSAWSQENSEPFPSLSDDRVAELWKRPAQATLEDLYSALLTTGKARDWERAVFFLWCAHVRLQFERAIFPPKDKGGDSPTLPLFAIGQMAGQSYVPLLYSSPEAHRRAIAHFKTYVPDLGVGYKPMWSHDSGITTMAAQDQARKIVAAMSESSARVLELTAIPEYLQSLKVYVEPWDDSPNRASRFRAANETMWRIESERRIKSGLAYPPRQKPNKAPEPTPTAVTSPAAQEPRQP